MLQEEIMKAIADANGINEDTWIRILSLVSDKDPAVQSVCCYGGRYYVTEAQRKRLQQMVPFMMGGPLALPPPQKEYVNTKFIEAGCTAGPDRCGHCKGPFHPATGHQFSETVVACGICYGRFAAWQLQNKFGWRPLTSKQQKKLDKKKKKQEKMQARALKDMARKEAEEAAEKERLYGKPREAQAGQNPILER